MLSDQKYTIYLVAPATNISDPTLQKDQLAIEVYQDNNPEVLAAGILNLNSPFTAGDIEITFTGSGHFSGFLVNTDPGIGLVWTAAILLLLGLITVFYFPRRQLRAAIIQNSEKGPALYLKWDNSGANSGEARKLVELLNSANYAARSGRTGKEER
jgi:cytochrome c biogenesis protein ResB